MKTQGNVQVSDEERIENFKRKFDMIAEKKQRKSSRFSFRAKRGAWFSGK